MKHRDWFDLTFDGLNKTKKWKFIIIISSVNSYFKVKINLYTF